MKKLITFSTICLIASLLLSSCKTATLAKRHYTKGYYLAHTKGKTQGSAASKEEKKIQPEIKKNLYTQSAPAGQNIEVNPVQIAAKTENANPFSAPAPKVETAAKHTVLNIETPAYQAKKQVSRILNQSHSREDGLSLFWIIILILLILWAIGFLAGGLGLGGLFNLVLLIALILLILWLLRVI